MLKDPPVYSTPRRECRAIDIHEGDKVEAALKDLIRAAVALNLMVKSKPKPRQAGRLASSQVPAVSPPIGEELRRLPHTPSTSASTRVRVMRERQQNHRCGIKTRLELRSVSPWILTCSLAISADQS